MDESSISAGSLAARRVIPVMYLASSEDTGYGTEPTCAAMSTAGS
jgi:hypothetical protein